MKLFAKYNRINLLSVVIIFLIASIAFSFLIRYVVINGIDEDLRIEKNEVLSYVRTYGTMPAIVEVHDQNTSYREVEKPPVEKQYIYTKKERNETDEELVRVIQFGVTLKNKNYLVTVSKSLEGSDNLITSIILITIGTIVLILAVTFFINRIVLRRLWQPFYNTLHTTEKFKLSDNSAIRFLHSEIDEFNLLNNTLSQTINKAQQDYISLKEFTENASHEMQTPLAVLRSKLDMMIQSEDLTEKQSSAVSTAYEAINGLKKLNQSLLLLAKIENRQFSEMIQLDLQAIVLNKQRQFCEQWQSENRQVNVTTSAATIYGNPQLTDILLNNLLSNATKHSAKGATITIALQPSELNISNTGKAKALDEQQIFNRFYKGDVVAAGSHGLGLSIVKQICDVSGYVCRYRFIMPDVHSFVISF